MTMTATRTDVFDRVVCCINDSAGSRVALNQAAAVLSPAGSLAIVTVVKLPLTYSAYGGAMIQHDLERDAGRLLDEASSVCAGARTELLYGGVVERVVTELEDVDATLAVVGGHHHHRPVGVLLGSTATRLVHRAPCSVLVARPAMEAFPRQIVVGDDGSETAARAVAAAYELAHRHDAHLRHVLTGSLPPSRVQVPNVEADVVEDPRHLHESLVEASALADLVVIGRYGRGAAAVRSESERLAHDAACSVLVVG
jgi:nucleotide-binding universal stress UspA family protein